MNKARQYVPYVILMGSFVVWAFIALCASPQQSSTDVFDFKDPGINFALGNGLATRLAPGVDSIELKPYGTYPPLFPFAFGVYTKIAGIGAKQDAFFETLLSLTLCLLLYSAITSSCKSVLYRSLAAAALAAPLLLTPCLFERERPDQLGMIWVAAAAHLAWKRNPKLWFTGAALCLILASLTSPFFLLQTILVLTCQLVLISDSIRTLPWRKAGYLAGAAIISIIVLFVVQTAISPEAVKTFISHGSGSGTSGKSGVGYLSKLVSGDWKGYLQGFSKIRSCGIIALMKLSIFGLGTGAALISLISATFRPCSSTIRLALWLLLLSIAATAIAFNYQINYYAASIAPVLLILALIAQTPTCDHFLKRVIQASLILILFWTGFLGSFMSARNSSIAWNIESSKQRGVETVGRFEDLTGDGHIVVATAPSLYYLFREQGQIPINMFRITPQSDCDQIDYYCFSYTGTGDPLSAQMPEYWENESFHKIFKPDLPQRVRYLGRITNSSNTWEPLVYERKKM